MRFSPFIIGGLLAACAAGAADLPYWSYDGDETGQEDWGSLSKDYAACEIGTQQSPVIIGSTVQKDLPKLEFHYAAAPAHVRFVDHVMAVEIDGKNTLAIGDAIYTLRRIVLHTPGEHELRDRFWPLEIEFEHTDKDGKPLILSILAETQGDNPGLQAIIDHAPQKPGPVANMEFNPGSLVPKEHGYFAYTGSLTTPPCTQGVEWRILKRPIMMMDAQLQALGSIIGRNARIPQPIYMRTISESKE